MQQVVERTETVSVVSDGSLPHEPMKTSNKVSCDGANSFNRQIQKGSHLKRLTG